MTLIYIPKSLPSESAASLLLRASFENGYTSLSSFLNAYGFPVHTKSLNSMLSDQEKFEKIAIKLGICKSNINIIPSIYGPTKRSQRIWKSQPISYQFFCADGSKLCTECINDNGILKTEWLLKHLTCCIIHQKKLITECNYCHHTISANRKKINECYKCNKVFNNQLNENILDNEIQANQWFLEQLSSTNLKLIKSIKNFLSSIQSTYITFKHFAMDEPPILLTYLFFTNQTKAEEVFNKIIYKNRLIGHPKLLLVHFLTSMQQNIQKFALELTKKYSFNYSKFKEIDEDFILTKRTTAILIGANRAKLDENYFSFLKNDDGFSAKKVNSFLLGNLTAPLESQKQDYFYLTLKEASEILGIYYELVGKLFSTDRLIQKKIIYKNNRPYTVLSKDDLIKFNQEYITVNRLAKDLDVLTQYLTAKLNSIGIKPIHGPFIDDVKIDVFRRNDVQHLTQDLIKSIKNHERGFGYKTKKKKKDTNELEVTSLKLKISIKEVKKLVHCKILKSYKRSLLQSFYISEASINYVDNILNSGDYINLNEVPCLLNCPPNWLKKYWIDTNFLNIIDLKIGKYVQKDILTEIKKLKQKYFTGVEASKYLGMSHQHITNLHSQGLIEAYFFGNEKKVRLFLKTDVYALKSKHGFNK